MMDQAIQNLAGSVKERMAMDSISKQPEDFQSIIDGVTSPTYPFLSAQNSGLYIDTPSSFATAVRVGTEMKYPLVEKCVEHFEGE